MFMAESIIIMGNGVFLRNSNVNRYLGARLARVDGHNSNPKCTRLLFVLSTLIRSQMKEGDSIIQKRIKS